jgi:hypothetical protein
MGKIGKHEFYSPGKKRNKSTKKANHEPGR